MINSFALAFQNVRTNFFHTVLSVLGIVIGVAALVAMLSFIDGLEKMVKDEITKTTSLNTVMISTETHQQTSNHVRVKKDSFAVLDYPHFERLLADVLHQRSLLFNQQTGLIEAGTKRIGAAINGVSAYADTAMHIGYGRALSTTDLQQKLPVVLISYGFAKELTGSDTVAGAIGQTLVWQGITLRVVGIQQAKSEEERIPAISIPISLFTHAQLIENPPSSLIEATDIEQVSDLKTQIKAGLQKQYGINADADFVVNTNDFRLDQVSQGFLLFRVIMGLIVGIAVLVGGVGVMNVLLISVNERTQEIGLRKAVGAKKGDIVRLFLAESITVSSLGSFLGLLFGVLSTLIIVPIINAFTRSHFEAVYTWNTFAVVSITAVLIGIVFGTYPALRAARLDPVEAIRRE